MGIELTNNGLLVKLTKHYTTQKLSNQEDSLELGMIAFYSNGIPQLIKESNYAEY